MTSLPNGEEFSFIGGASLPEPSSLLTLALGIGGLSLAWVARFVKEHPLT